MKVVILAGGLGSRLSEETRIKPKPMVEIGSRPIIWHIMKIYSHYGFNDFVICTGYLGHIINDYFLNYRFLQHEFTVDVATGQTIIHDSSSVDPWKVTIVNSGIDTMTGGRLKSIRHHINDTFMMTYGDGVSNVDLHQLAKIHSQTKSLATLTAVQPRSRYGALRFRPNTSKVSDFSEKPESHADWINGGFFVLEPEVIDMIHDKYVSFESQIMPKLANTNNLQSYKHTGFWQSMDTLRDKLYLESLLESGVTPWMTWRREA